MDYIECRTIVLAAEGTALCHSIHSQRVLFCCSTGGRTSTLIVAIQGNLVEIVLFLRGKLVVGIQAIECILGFVIPRLPHFIGQRQRRHIAEIHSGGFDGDFNIARVNDRVLVILRVLNVGRNNIAFVRNKVGLSGFRDCHIGHLRLFVVIGL